VPDRRRHRGPHPDDAADFAADRWPALRAAVADLSWLLTRGYTAPAAVKLVGDRHGLTARQRTAMQRCACTDAARAARAGRRVAAAALAGRPLAIDGYNVLITVEAALAGGVLLRGRDGCLRDLASLHGTFRAVAETGPALDRLGAFLADAGAAEATWFLDRPVSNSGRLRAAMAALARERGWAWTVTLVPDADRALGTSAGIVATSDSVVLDRCGPWVDLPAAVVATAVPGARVIDAAPATCDAAGDAAGA
jgi:hypothetical protein